MTKPIPHIQKYMTTSPHSVGPEQTLAVAHRMMREHHIRHLPVLQGGKLVGIISERDLAIITSMQGASEKMTTVEDAMSSDVYSVSPDAPLDEVVAEMAEKKHGSAVIIQNGKTVGMFTTTDACRTLAELLHERLAK